MFFFFSKKNRASLTLLFSLPKFIDKKKRVLWYNEKELLHYDLAKGLL